MGEPFFPKGSEDAADFHYAKKDAYESVFGSGSPVHNLSGVELKKKWSVYQKLAPVFQVGKKHKHVFPEHQEGDGG